MDTSATARRRRLVVGIDGSEHANRALRWAHHLAAPLVASIDVLYAWEKPPPYVSPIADSDWDPAVAAQEMLQHSVVEALGDPGPSVRLIVRQDNPVRALVGHSRDAYLLIVGSRGHGAAAGLLLGSVSARCAQEADCPVLVVHDREPPTP